MILNELKQNMFSMNKNKQNNRKYQPRNRKNKKESNGKFRIKFSNKNILDELKDQKNKSKTEKRLRRR